MIDTLRSRVNTASGSKGGVGGLLMYWYGFMDIVVDWRVMEAFSQANIQEFVTGSILAFLGVGTIAARNRDLPSPREIERQPQSPPAVVVRPSEPPPVVHQVDRYDKPVVTPVKKNWFSDAELDCKCQDLAGCDYQGMNSQVMTMINDLREQFGPLVVTSGYRCLQHNNNVGGSPASYHVRGMAVDLKSPEVMPETLYNYLNARYPNQYGIGLYKTFVHVDCRTEKWARKTSASGQWRQFDHVDIELAAA